MDFPETRWSLIGRLAEQPDQVAVVLELYADPIGRYLRGKFSSDTALARLDDVIQEVLVYLMQHPELLSRAHPGEIAAGQASRFRYFIMTLAYNAARNAMRRHIHQREMNAAMGDDGETTVAEALAVAHQPTDEVQQAMDRAWAESLLMQAWRDLSAWAEDGTLEKEIPAIVRANLVDGRNLRDISSELNIPLATCHRRLARGRTYLQKALADRLRQAGEINAQEDGIIACEVLLNALKA
jgi:DNA-directed RNA polymerase specialized sigma24 family protein